MEFISIISSALSTLGTIALDTLKSFNPFKDEEYQGASYEDQKRIETRVTDIANDETLDHEYRMEAQRVLVQIESYRHAEELARIDGTTKITIVQIEATKEIVIAKRDILKESIIRSSDKELAYINAIGNNPELADLFIKRLDDESNDTKQIGDKVDLYDSEILNLTRLIQNTKIEAIEYKKAQDSYIWANKLWAWADENNITDSIPRVLNDLIQLTELRLSSNNLTEIPKEIGNLTNLTNLSLSDNQLTEIPKEIGNLTQLTHLYLSYNKLTEIPKIISSLTNLTELYLFENKLTELPKEIGNLTQLTHLYLYHNQLTELPKEIGNLTQLTELHLGYNQLTELPKEISNLTQLIVLHLDHNNNIARSDFIRGLLDV
ncbi:MAG: Leucine-rich repeat (LRR) protein [Oleiphilaceae bacterium]|jgi:Leucine-rich repeat (LRR) protein